MLKLIGFEIFFAVKSEVISSKVPGTKFMLNWFGDVLSNDYNLKS